ncbi:MAG: protein kinase [Myxococcales bacterium]|nr:protein kinase [Myxococcales bacterium]MBL0197912.1 protein kinase [Myxococcales bacterium]HQY63914.1 serine/threonine-protein kinase [Polyangiaceae bacterium]
MSDEWDTVPGGPFPRGTAFGSYVVEELIGEGGMAAVYRARHAKLGRDVALKVMHSSLAASDGHVRRFMQEARSAASLKHPNIADVTDVGELDGRPYIVMEYLEGESVAALLARRGRLTPLEIADLVLPLVSALGAAHNAGLIHRDIKPENVFLAREARGAERPVLLDFGISKQLTSSESRLTQVGQFVGTPYYMSPEQIQMNVQIDGRADGYALGVMLYELATGVLPYRSDQSLYVLLAEIVLGRAEPPSLHEPTLPPQFERVVLRAMSCDREKRFATVEELGSALLPFASPQVQAVWADDFEDKPLLADRPMSVPPARMPSWRAPAAELTRPALPTSVVLSAPDLRVIPDLDGCPQAELDTFLLAVGAFRYPAGAVLFEQGAEADGCFVVLEGEVEIVRESHSRRDVLAVIGPGEFVGQVALVEDALRSASVIARSDSLALCIGRDVFHRLLASGCGIAAQLQRMLAVSGIRQLRTATRRLSRLLEERAIQRDDTDQTPRLERLRAAISEWSVAIDTLPPRPDH